MTRPMQDDQFESYLRARAEAEEQLRQTRERMESIARAFAADLNERLSSGLAVEYDGCP